MFMNSLKGNLMIRTILRRLTFLVVIATFAMGCGNAHNLQFVTGTVTLDGVPIEGVTVTFSPVSNDVGLAGGGYTNSQGVFTVTTTVGDGADGTQPGKYFVTFRKTVPERKYTQAEIDSSNNDGAILPEIKYVSVIPEKYTKPETSGMEVEVVSGRNEFNFDLVSK